MLFLLLLVVFVAVRWDKDQWVEQKLSTLVEQQQLPLSWGRLHVSGMQLEFSDVQWKDARLSVPVELDSLRLSPAWKRLVQADAAAHVEAQWQGNPLSVDVFQHDTYTQLSDLYATLNIESIRPFLPVTAELQGQVVARGHVQLDAFSMPVDGSLTLTLPQAMIATMGVKLALAAAELTLQHDQDERWTWTLHVGGDIQAEGSGTVMISTAQPESWQLAGDLSVATTATTPPLLSTMISSAGPNGFKLRLSGALGQIRTQQM